MADSAGIVNPPDEALFDVIARRDADGRLTYVVPRADLQQALDTAGDWWQKLARQAIRAMSQTCETWTIDDLRTNGLVPDPVNPSGAWGAAISAAANAGEITCCGYRRSRRKAARSRIVSVWRGTDAT